MEKNKLIGTGCIAAGVGIYLWREPKLGFLPDFPYKEYIENPRKSIIKIINLIIPEDWKNWETCKKWYEDAVAWEEAERWKMIKARFNIGLYTDIGFSVAVGTRSPDEFIAGVLPPLLPNGSKATGNAEYRKYISRAAIKYGQWDFRLNALVLGQNSSYSRPITNETWADSIGDWTAPKNDTLSFLTLGITSIPAEIVAQANTATWDAKWASLCLYRQGVEKVKTWVLYLIKLYNYETASPGMTVSLGSFDITGGGDP